MNQQPIDSDLALVRCLVDSCRYAAARGLDELAHDAADSAWEVALSAIARDGCQNRQELAREALKTEEIVFERWCA